MAAVFTLQDANQIERERYVNVETSSRWLREVSDMIRHHEWASYDMTGTTHADWRAFLAQLRNKGYIIGPGVLRFEVHLLDIIPPNEQCYAFVVRRVDGTDAWVRPGTDTIGVGCLEDWLPRRATATPRGRPLYRLRPAAALLADPRPNIGRGEILLFLQEQEHDLRVQCITTFIY